MQDAEIVIIGGGAIGCSTAYHLAKKGCGDVVLLEKSGLTQGATWHAAGLVGQLRSKQNLTRMMQYSAELCAAISAETEVENDWRGSGSLRLAGSPERWAEIKRSHGQAKAFGLEMDLLTPAEARDLFPYMSTAGIVGAAFIPGDGHVDPSGLTQAYARGARNGGVRIEEGVRVMELVVENRRITRVVTDQGTIRCAKVLNAAGLWARKVAAMAGVRVPAGVVEHQYMVTEKGLDVTHATPSLRDPDSNFYLKPDVGGFAIGGWEQGTKPLPDGLPFEFGRELFASNFERFENIILPAAERLPVLNEVGIQNLINGPIPISPDGEPIMGLAPGLENFYLACGFTSGIAASGGAGRAMAEWMVEGDPGMDLWAFDARRFGAHHANTQALAERGVEAYSRYYVVHFPNEEMTAARGTRQSPFYAALKAEGAVYGAKFGWERPNWFAPKGVAAEDAPSFGRANWFEHVGQEHRAVRERAALFDQSSFTKFEVSGPGAGKFLQHLAANDMDREPGAAIYTQLCNDQGGIEADLTVMRLSDDRYYIVTGSGFGVRDAGWIESHMPKDGSVTFSDVTSGYAVINLAGPRARDVLAQVCDDDLSNDAFPYMTWRDIDVGYAPVRAVRITYVGELGWELHIPVEFAAHVYGALKAAGETFDIVNAGYRAIDTLRMEKRYLYWGADISPDYTPLEAGLGFCVAFAKGNFRGSDALARQKEAGVTRKLCCFTLDRDADVYGGEAVWAGGALLGITTSGNFGHTVGKPIVFAYLPADEARRETVEVECLGERVPATRVEGAAYDPGRERVLV